MRRAEHAGAGIVAGRLPLCVPLAGLLLLALLVDRTFGVTTLVVAPQVGWSGGPASGWSGAGRTGVGVAAAVLSDAVAVVVVLGVLAIAEVTGRPRRRGATVTVLVAAALVGLQLGAAAAGASTGVVPPSDLYLARALLLAGTTVASVRVLAALAEHRRATEELRSATAAAASLAVSGRDALGRLREDVAGRVREVLREALAALEVGTGTGAGTRLRSLADEVLRPLSHRLAIGPVVAEAPAPTVVAAGWRDTFATLLHTPVVPAHLLALITTGLALLRSFVTDQDAVRDLSPAIPDGAEGIGIAVTVDAWLLLVVFGELAAVYVVARWGGRQLAALLERRRLGLRPAGRWTIVVLGVAGITGLSALASELVERVAGTGPATVDVGAVGIAFTASFVPLVAVTVGVSLSAAVATGRAALEADLSRQRAETARAAARVQAVLSHEQRRLARSLHADVQATVNAAGLLLDRADREEGVTPSLVDEVAGRIAMSVERFLSGGPSTRPVAERLAEVRQLWSGVCTVDLTLGDATGARIDADAVARELIVDVVTEACANAVVHGDAGDVRVRIAVVEDEVELEVVDDGSQRGPAEARGGRAPDTAGPGLGTEVLRASCTSFTLDVANGGSRLHAMIPLG